MPKRVVRDVAGTNSGSSSLATWQSAGLSLAMLITAFVNGLGALAGGVALVAVIWSLARLRRRAPTARSTCDLVGVALGERASTMVALLQMCAYLFLASYLASRTGFLHVLSPWVSDPDLAIDSWWWPVSSAVAVVVAGVVVYALSTRVLAAICAVLAGAAALIVFYLALAVVAKVLGGTEPMQVGQQPTSAGLEDIATVLLLGLTVVGIEVVTTANSQLRSAARPMGLALAAGMACTALVWTADQVGTTGGFSYGADNFLLVVAEFFGVPGTNWLLTVTICANISGLLTVTWALIRVAGPIGQRFTSGTDMPGDLAAALVLIPVVAVIAIAVCRNWGVLAVTPSVAPILLIVVYLFVAEASARLPRWENLTWTIKVLTAVVLVAVVLVPLLYAWSPDMASAHEDFAANALWRVAIAGLLVAAAAGVAARWPDLVGVDAANRGDESDEASGVAMGRR